MRRIAGLLFAALLGSVAAQAGTDSFTVKGTNPNGGGYSGTVSVTQLEPGGKVDGRVFAVEWVIAGETVKGVGMASAADPKTLVISYPVGERAAGVAVMSQGSGNEVAGVWYVEDLGAGTEVWTPAARPSISTSEPRRPASGTEPSYARVVECAAATSFVVGMLRATPGSDAAKIDAYDKANSAWIMKLTDLPEGKDMQKSIDDIRAKQGSWPADAAGLATATPIADECVATAPAM